MPFDAIIFDLDGTLLDSLDDIANAANQVLSEFGKPTHPIAEFKYLVGDGVSVLFQRALPDCETDSVLRKRCMHRFEQVYDGCWNNRSKPYDGIMELLHSMKQRGKAMAVLSNKPDTFTKKCVSHFFQPIPFQLVVGHSERFPRKPDPSSALWMVEQLNIASDRIAYVGDTNTDMKTAVGARLFAIGVSWGFRPESELVAAGANVICQSAEDLHRVLVGEGGNT